MSLDSYLNNLINLDNTPPFFSFHNENKKWGLKNGQIVYQMNPNFYDLRPFTLILKQINNDLDLFDRNGPAVESVKINSFKTLLENKVNRYHEKNSTLFGQIKKIIQRLFFGNIDDLKNKIFEKINYSQRRVDFHSHEPLSTHEPFPSLVIPHGKRNAINAYVENPSNCTRNIRSIIFLDIRSIVSTSSLDLTSVESYLKYFGRTDEINLKDPLCIAFIKDCFKELSKEASIRLVEWLIEQNTFDVELWGDSINCILEREQNGQPINTFSIEKLIGFYRVNYERLKNTLSVNDPILLNALSSLIKNDPNNDRVIEIGTWLMNQNEFTISSFAPWLRIFQSKERQFSASRNLYYPLLNLIVAKVKEMGGEEILNQQTWDQDLQNYLRIKLSPSVN
jgi:hypothetical protein